MVRKLALETFKVGFDLPFTLLKKRARHLRYFLIFSIIKFIFGIFYQVNLARGGGGNRTGAEIGDKKYVLSKKCVQNLVKKS